MKKLEKLLKQCGTTARERVKEIRHRPQLKIHGQLAELQALARVFDHFDVRRVNEKEEESTNSVDSTHSSSESDSVPPPLDNSEKLLMQKRVVPKQASSGWSGFNFGQDVNVDSKNDNSDSDSSDPPPPLTTDEQFKIGGTTKSVKTTESQAAAASWTWPAY